MEEKQLLERIEQLNREQVKYAKLQCIFTAIAAVCCGVAVIALLLFLPKVGALVGQMDTVLTQLDTVLGQVETALAQIQVVAEQLAGADLGSLARDISSLVTSSQAGLEEALGKITAIDIQTLNEAIADLSAVIQPLKRILNTFL